jgi:hypothetical protein
MTDHLGPNPAHRSETATRAAPVAARAGISFGARGWVRPVAGLITVLVIAGVVALAAGLFRGSFTETVPLTVISDRAGLVMNPDAKVKMRGVQVGKVASIDARSDGTAVLHLAMDPAALQKIPSNVLVNCRPPWTRRLSPSAPATSCRANASPSNGTPSSSN